jgi:hypothetical protein
LILGETQISKSTKNQISNLRKAPKYKSQKGMNGFIWRLEKRENERMELRQEAKELILIFTALFKKRLST